MNKLNSSINYIAGHLSLIIVMIINGYLYGITGCGYYVLHFKSIEWFVSSYN